MVGFCYAGVGDCQNFMVTEIAVQKAQCYEELTVDLGSNKLLSNFVAKYSGFIEGSVSTSIDGLTYANRITLGSPPVSSSQSAQYSFQNNIVGRYLKFRFITSSLPARLWDRVYVTDITLYGQNYVASTGSCPNSCSKQGSCNTLTGQCNCNNTFTGIDCSVLQCQPSCISGQGKCTNGVCVCNIGYTGNNCGQSICPFNCWNHGTCNAGKCTCDSKYTGSDCRFEIKSTMVGSIKSNFKTLDRNMILGNTGLLQPPQRNYAQTTFYKNQLRENSMTPFVCSVGGKSISIGNCSLQTVKLQRTSKPNSPSLSSTWNSQLYDTTSLSVSSLISSSSSSSAKNVIDNNINTFWQSGQCYPTGYLTYSNINILSNICGNSPSSCKQSSTSSSPVTTSATDLNTNNAIGISLVSGLAFFQITLPTPTTLRAISAKVSTSSVSVYGIVSGSNKKVFLSTITTSYSFVNIDISKNSTQSKFQFSSIRLESSSGFSLFEISARSSVCSEFVTLDLGSSQTITGLTVRHWSGSNTASSVSSTLYEGSIDGNTWISLSNPLSPQVLNQVDVEVYPSLSLRYIRVSHVLNELSSVKVMLWEISVWGSSGKYGTVNSNVNPVSFRDLVGVNGIWGFGTNSYSSSLSVGKGPDRYSKMSSHARNYHNWIWDVNDPDNVPAFDRMVGAGSTDFGKIPGPQESSLNQKWLNWDNEYTTWKKNGLEVEASIQFTPSSFPQSVFTNPYQAGYNYGYSFAKHFGRLTGTGDVSTIEVGNEPWMSGSGYSDPNFYRQVLSGMSEGVKSADPTIRVLPAAFGSLNDTLKRVTPNHIKYLDGWNIHTYSWIQTSQGRTGIYPEHSLSTLHSVNSLIRFRDSNTPNLPIYLTEWGWDSAGGGEDCNPPPERSSDSPFPECVSEDAQALYAIRGALVLARKGLSRLTWYFYGNTQRSVSDWDNSKGVFSRSGLTSSSTAGFQNKKSLYALEEFMYLLGDTHFLSIIREDHDAYVYVLGHNSTSPTHIVAWRPISADDTSIKTISINLVNIGPISYLRTLGNNISTCPTSSQLTFGENSATFTISRCPFVFSISLVGTVRPTAVPSSQPTKPLPTIRPSFPPTFSPSIRPTRTPTNSPTFRPSPDPTILPTSTPTPEPSFRPSRVPTIEPTLRPTREPTFNPTLRPSREPTLNPTFKPTREPTLNPTGKPTRIPTFRPTVRPSLSPPTRRPTN
mmetsp:Transcript_5877/g.6091  ORF Transcript_5877/g.6091 Transcript_5877/m.6091 type:complete len:1210 (+) Transcript_5877:764-4393(+)